jgi:hypothetical protein
MRVPTKSWWLRLAAAACLLAAPAAARAQSLVWNAPSTDVQSRGSTYVEVDYLSHPGSAEAGGYRSYGVRGVYGLSNSVEVGLNGFRTETDGASVELQPNAKWQFYQDERRGVAAVAGGVLFLSLAPRRGPARAGLVYAAVGKQLGGELGPRLTGGAYGMVGGGPESGTRAGVLAGYEQPIARRVSLLADWCSGANRVGYGGVGLALTLTPRSGLYVGYSVGNQGRANNGFAVCFSRTF